MWNWLEHDKEAYRWGFVLRVILKAVVFFGLCNLIYATVNPLNWLGGVSLYGNAIPARTRLPYGENPAQSYNLSVDNLDAMFSAVNLSYPKKPNEFRVLVVGDSATWGWFLQANETYMAGINAAKLKLADGRLVSAYNIGYPVLSVTKDLILLDYATRYKPDMVIWLVTAQSMRYSDERGIPIQTGAPVSQWNRTYLTTLINRYDLNLDTPSQAEASLLSRTLIGQRQDLAGLLRLQAYGFAWGATGIDQYIPADYPLRQTDLDANEAWANFEAPTTLTRDDLAFDVLAAGAELVGDVPIVIINEPIFISNGDNSDIRYNSFYPRWAYDNYREIMSDIATDEGWLYVDWWDTMPPDAFTDSPVHLNPTAAQELSIMLIDLVEETVDGRNNR